MSSGEAGQGQEGSVCWRVRWCDGVKREVTKGQVEWRDLSKAGRGQGVGQTGIWEEHS